MTAKDPYKDSPYDASGMPLATETVDYDKKEDVAKATVKDKVEEFPTSINDIDYTPAEIDPKLVRSNIKKKNFNSAIEDNVNSAHPDNDVAVVDFDEATLDNSDAKEVKETVDTAKTPNEEKKSDDKKSDDDDTSFLDGDEKKEDKGKK